MKLSFKSKETQLNFIRLGIIALIVGFTSLLNGEMRSSVSQWGITWTFDKPYEVGKFANDDWWVVGPVKITNITPASIISGGRALHGSMTNPNPTRSNQGYDGKMNFNNYGPAYVAGLNVGMGISSSNPLILSTSTSLVSAVSKPTLPTTITSGAQKAVLQTAAVLTVLGQLPTPGSFRPPYAGADKTIKFNKSQLDYSKLANLDPVGSAPSFTDAEPLVERVWLDHLSGPLTKAEESSIPSSNMPNYGREISSRVGYVAMLLNTNASNQTKEKLFINLVQAGIDMYGVVSRGGHNNWKGMGGHHSGRFFTIIFAGVVLGDSEMSAIGSKTLPNGGTWHFGEIDQTFYVEETSPGVINYGVGGYTAADVGMAEWALRHWWYLGKTSGSIDNKSWSARYRTCCTATGWAGFILASHAMGIQSLWQHDAIFDYLDRFMKIMVGERYRQYNDYTEEMWDKYRTTFTSTSNRSVYFTSAVRTGLPPLNVSFSNKSAAEFTSFSWDFGDGATSTESSPSHTYTSLGLFTVTLTATGPGGTETFVQKDYVNVKNEPIVVEAEDMQLSIYQIDTNSKVNGKAILIDPLVGGTGTATTIFTGQSGIYTIALEVIPENDGTPSVSVIIDGITVISETLPIKDSYYDLKSRIIYEATGISLSNGELITIEGTAQAEAYARIDRISFTCTNCAASNSISSPTVSGNSLQSIISFAATPVKNSIELNILKNMKEPVSVSLYSVNGSKVLNKLLSGNQSYSIDISRVEGGLYFLKIISEGVIYLNEILVIN